MSRIAAALIIACAAVGAAGCSNFNTVEEGRFYRSAQPSAGELTEWIEEYGLKTVIRLRGGDENDPGFRASRDPALAAGIDFIHIPMSARRWPPKDQLLKLWDALENAEYPVLVHCRAGADRSGLVSGLYVLRETGSAREAVRQLRFFPYLHTGWQNTIVLHEVFWAYEPHEDSMPFPVWVEQFYELHAHED